ncbi:hypothetical protein OSTOST_16486, partial [Ostertagia ostertagi]
MSVSRRGQYISEEPTAVNCSYTDCANGRCFVESGVKQCKCLDGFLHVNGTCVPDSCQHTFCSKIGHGTCEESEGFGTCHCGSGFEESRFCEVENAGCPTCAPDHTCLLVIGQNANAAQHQCACAMGGVVGKCPWDPCWGRNCGPHGKCVPKNDTRVEYSCECEP